MIDTLIRTQRAIVHRTRGSGHGPITRLMSPSDLGQVLKPFVFLDLFEVEGGQMDMPVHPHSGIGTITVFTKGDVRFDDPDSGQGTITYGGVEWSRAGGGMWHGKELAPGTSPRFQGFQLWIALPPELENGPSESQYLEAPQIQRAGPAHVIVGAYDGVESPVRAPEGINYLLVTLKPGESWTYQPPTGHSVAWLAIARGQVEAGEQLSAGDMAVFDRSEAPLRLAAEGDEDAMFVLGSAVPHPNDLHLGYYSVHTSAEALERGEQRIAELGEKLAAAGDRRTGSGATPVFR
ncbi:pirin family protein [Sphingomonas sp. URHD0057]|uniref:pirin family protein n=1 Tax=Sphingomonas sp. URHD0057 TaxID=1380389 RepID=UPI00056BD4B4|nr:pirin family protein [Sphingomonas sp. URHD0057]